MDKKLIIEAYSDLVSPTAKELGITLKELTNVVLKPVRGIIWGFDTIIEYIKVELLNYFAERNIDISKINPNFDKSIVVPTIEALRYTKDDIKQMFIHLLGASLCKETSEFVHPAFVEILKQMTSDEAKIIKQLPKKSLYEPIIDIEVQKAQINGIFTVFSNFSVIADEAGCEYPEKGHIYINNLLRLGLVDVPPSSYLIDDWRYEKIFNNKYFNKQNNIASQYGKVTYRKKMVGLTSLGFDLQTIVTS